MGDLFKGFSAWNIIMLAIMGGSVWAMTASFRTHVADFEDRAVATHERLVARIEKLEERGQTDRETIVILTTTLEHIETTLNSLVGKVDEVINRLP